jgi:hypothetical protein
VLKANTDEYFHLYIRHQQEKKRYRWQLKRGGKEVQREKRSGRGEGEIEGSDDKKMGEKERGMRS